MAQYGNGPQLSASAIMALREAADRREQWLREQYEARGIRASPMPEPMFTFDGVDDVRNLENIRDALLARFGRTFHVTITEGIVNVSDVVEVRPDADDCNRPQNRNSLLWREE